MTLVPFWLSLLAPGAVAAPQRPSLAALIERVDARYSGLNDFEARFTQRYVRRALGKTIEERGKVAIKRPGRMRWEYESPERKLFVSDGKKTYFYLPEERQVIVSQEPAGALAGDDDSPLAVLAGRRRLMDAFAIAEAEVPATDGSTVLRLTPHRPDPEVSEAELAVDPEKGQIRRLRLVDGQGNTTEFQFTEVRENRRLADSLFTFTAPPGVEIVLASDSAPWRPGHE